MELLYDRRGADHHALAVVGDEANRRQEIPEALADARSRLDEQATAPRERLLDRLRHAALLRTGFESRQTPGDRALRMEKLLEREAHRADRIRTSRTRLWRGMKVTGILIARFVKDRCPRG